MIVEITSDTPRVTLRYPAMPAHTPPTATAVMTMTIWLSTGGSMM